MSDSKALVPAKAKKETLPVEYQKFFKTVQVNKDFAVINQAGRYMIEPTRDLVLKVITHFRLNFDTDIISVKDRKLGKTTITEYTVKARVWEKDGTQSTGLGIANTADGHTEGREDHDALTRAETRALKRAVEGRSGMTIINQMIQYFFGAYQIGPAKAREMGFNVKG